MWQFLLNISDAHAQELIPCPDGTMADPSIGCAEVPGGLVSPQSDLLEIILKFSETLLSVVAGVAVLVVIYGAVRYMMALGNDEDLRKAKRILFWSVFGLIVALLARYVTGFILSFLI